VGKYYVDSKVEVRGLLARYYDLLLDLMTLGTYRRFLKEAISYMSIGSRDRILDLGCGTGKNARLMRNYLSNEGSIMGLDISEVMIKQFIGKCNIFPNVKIMFARADKALPFNDEVFDKILISFLMHGFPQDIREHMLGEAHRVLKHKGQLFIFDYNEFIFENAPVYIRIFFRALECPYAFDFIKRDWETILFSKHFDSPEKKLFFNNCVRVLKARKIN